LSALSFQKLYFSKQIKLEQKGVRKMSIFNLYVFVIFFLSTYFSIVISEKIVKKKWNFGISIFPLFIILMLSWGIMGLSDFAADAYVKNNVPYKWEEQFISSEKITDVSRNLETTGSFFLPGIGDIYQSETLRYSIIGDDGGLRREKIYTSNCTFMKVNKVQEVVCLRYIRAYKNPKDKEFFRNHGDRSASFYRVYIL
jgi:hypothetical protein